MSGPRITDEDGTEAAQERLQEVHKPFSDDGVLYCGWATGDRIVDGCGELYPCSTLRSTPNALALASASAPAVALGCGICNGLPGNSGCFSCQGTGRFSPTPAPHPRPAVDREAIAKAIHDAVWPNCPNEHVIFADGTEGDAADAVLALLNGGAS